MYWTFADQHTLNSRQIGSICHLLTAQATHTLVCTSILSRLDCCNCLLSGCPQFLIDRLQKVQNAAARLICRAKKLDHVQPILQSLHWLPIRARIQCKISTLCFNVFTGTGPQYLSELLHLYTPFRDLLSSADTRILKILRSNSKAFGQRSFSHVGLSTLSAILTLRHHLDRLWNPISFNKVFDLLLLFLWRIVVRVNFLLRACVCVRARACVD